jgi:hypothetical protein
MNRRILVTLGLAGLLAASAGPASAVEPVVETIPIDVTFSPPLLSAACGFTVQRHVEGSLTVRSFYDGQGALSRELTQFHLVETLSANGRSLTGTTSQQILVKVFDDGSYSVAWAGTDFKLAVAGAGIVFGSTGRLLITFTAGNDVIDVRESGPSHADLAAICDALESQAP